MNPLLDDYRMRSLVERYGELTLEPAEKPFERLVISIAHQQLSTDSASAIINRLVNQFNVTPQEMLKIDDSELREIGFSSSKINYIKNAAEAFRDNEFSRERMHTLSNKKATERLAEIKGIGPWTAKMYLMFVLARKDIFPVEDLGIRKGFQFVYGNTSRNEMIQKAKTWSPLRSIASLYLWKKKRESNT